MRFQQTERTAIRTQHKIHEIADRRYQRAAALAEDIERYLQGWAIEAKRDCHWYVLRKAVHRHMAAVAITTAAAVLVTVFAAAMTVLYLDAEKQRRLAERRTQEARLAEMAAETERDTRRSSGPRNYGGTFTSTRLRSRRMPMTKKTLPSSRSSCATVPRICAGGSCAMFSPDGQMIVSGGADGAVRFWSADTGIATMVLPDHGARVTAVAFSPDGATLASGGWDRTVRVWDVASGEQILRLDHEDANVNAVAFSPDGVNLVSGSEDRTVRLWDVESGLERNNHAPGSGNPLEQAFTDRWRQNVSFPSEVGSQ